MAAAVSDDGRPAFIPTQTPLAVQVVLNCDDKYDDNGCHEGDPLTSYRFIYEEPSGGIPDETCRRYEAVGHDTGESCHPHDICENCERSKGCWAQNE